MYTDFEIARTVALPYFKARLSGDERGASMVEYALVLALIAVVGVLGLTFLGNKTAETLSCSGGAISGDVHDNGTPADPTDDFYDVDEDGVKGDKDPLVSDCG